MEKHAKIRSMLQQLSVAIEQHHQAYLGQQPLVLMAQDDINAIVDYAKEIVDGLVVSPEGKVMAFGAEVVPSEHTIAGRFLVAKVVYYV